MRAMPIGAMAMFEPAESVILKAVIDSLSRSALEIKGWRSVPFGGLSSHVTTNFPDARASDNLLNLDLSESV